MTFGDLEKETYETLYPLYLRAQRCFANLLGYQAGPRNLRRREMVVHLMMLTNTGWLYDASKVKSKVFRLEASSLDELDLRLTLEGY